MTTVKFDLDLTPVQENWLLRMQEEYSYAFRSLYVNSDKINDKDYLKHLRDKHKLSAYVMNCLKSEVEGKVKITLANKKREELAILDLEEEIERLEKKDKLDRKERKHLFKFKQKLAKKIKRLSKDITFGSLTVLRRISFLHNKINQLKIDLSNINPLNEKEYEKVQQELSKAQQQLKDKDKEFHDNRILDLYFIGSLNDRNSNRFFEFDFKNNEIVFKPYQGFYLRIKYKVKPKYQKQLLELQKVKDLKMLPITVRISNNCMSIVFDNAKLNGNDFNVKGYFKAKNELLTREDQIECYKEFKQEHIDRMLGNRGLDYRYVAIDLNPEYIGFVVLDKTKKPDRPKVIFSKCYVLSDLIKSTGKESSSKETKEANDKRKFEIGKIYDDMFKHLIHFRAGNFCMEDLDFKPNVKKDIEKSREVNRKTKNIWNLNFQQNLVKKHCQNIGINLIEVNPMYSSVIGNLMYRYFDPVNSAIEIGRRGMNAFVKGQSLYPDLTETIKNTVVERFKESFPDVSCIKDCSSWVSLYQTLKQTGCIYRWGLEGSAFQSFSKKYKRNHWKVYSF